MGRDQIYRSTLDAVGETPLVQLSKMFDEGEGRVLAKLENTNPTGSKKDRVARQILMDARKDGRLAPHQTVVELTDGNTAIGLAMASAVLGHPFVAVMPDDVPEDRVVAIEAFGGRVVGFEASREPGQVSQDDFQLAEDTIARIVREQGAFRADPFRSLANFRAHRLGTGPEIVRQSGGKIDAFCDFVGSGGTLAGCTAAFKEHRMDIRCYAVEPEGAAVLAGQEVTRDSHSIQGGGYQRTDLTLLDRDRIDGYVQVSDEQAELETRRLALQEGILAGWSSGANVAAARQLLAGPRHGETIVIVIADSGMRYLSSPLWGGATEAARTSQPR
jgi:cysteine synthase